MYRTRLESRKSARGGGAVPKNSVIVSRFLDIEKVASSQIRKRRRREASRRNHALARSPPLACVSSARSPRHLAPDARLAPAASPFVSEPPRYIYVLVAVLPPSASRSPLGRDALSCAPQPRAASRILCIYAVRSSPCCMSLVSDPTRYMSVFVAVLPPSRSRLARDALSHACMRPAQPRACVAYIMCRVCMCPVRSSPCCVGRLRVVYMCAASVDNYVSCVACRLRLGAIIL